MHITVRNRVSKPFLALLLVIVGLVATGFFFDAQPALTFAASRSVEALPSPPVMDYAQPNEKSVAEAVGQSPSALVSASPTPPQFTAGAEAHGINAGDSEEAVPPGPPITTSPYRSPSVSLPVEESPLTQARAPVPETRAAGGLLTNHFFQYLVGVTILILLFLNLFRVGPSAEAFPSDVFKMLSSETRVSMLHALHERRKTLSELAKERAISLPGAKQHLEQLEDAGLVRKMDEGRKWKYYELTDLGKRIISERLA
ncbi:helix-turn-helix domain-containing protein [Candidatus Micrarchaeota archaeon]|nr:helix-turn-helix domain-containing protein [Candidatus Micrarchaeota archaeon]